MTKIIEHISINDLFEVHFKSHLVSFGFKGLPNDTPSLTLAILNKILKPLGIKELKERYD